MKLFKNPKERKPMSVPMGMLLIGLGIVWIMTMGQLSFWLGLLGAAWTGLVTIMTMFDFDAATKRRTSDSFGMLDKIDELYKKGVLTNENAEALIADECCPHCGSTLDMNSDICLICGKEIGR